MKRILLVSAIAFATMSGAAFAQSSQGQGGAQAGVNGNAPNSPDSLRQDEVRPGITTGMGNEVAEPNRMRPMNPSASDPSSEGNVGPGTTNNNTMPR
jgi:opacity protein-like surface antigen